MVSRNVVKKLLIAGACLLALVVLESRQVIVPFSNARLSANGSGAMAIADTGACGTLGPLTNGSQVMVKATSTGALSVCESGPGFQFYTVTTDATVGARTYTAAELVGGLILRDPNGGDRSDVSPTAALIATAIGSTAVGGGFEFTIRNTADAAETITLTGGTNVTISGTATIAQNNTKRWLAVVTATTPTVTIYSLGTSVH